MSDKTSTLELSGSKELELADKAISIDLEALRAFHLRTLALKVEDDESLEKAKRGVVYLRAQKKNAEKTRKDITAELREAQKRLKAAIKKIDDRFKPVEAQADETVAVLQGLVNAYLDVRAAAEQARIAEAQAEAKRDHDERVRKFKETADKLAEEGKAEEAARVQEAAKDLEPVVTAVETRPPKVEGLVERRIWKASVEDLGKLYAARPEFVQLVPRVRDLTSYASRMEKQKKTPSIPGVTFKKVTSL